MFPESRRQSNIIGRNQPGFSRQMEFINFFKHLRINQALASRSRVNCRDIFRKFAEQL